MLRQHNPNSTHLTKGTAAAYIHTAQAAGCYGILYFLVETPS